MYHVCRELRLSLLAGALALNRKARASGVVAGMAMAAQGSGGAPSSAAGQAAAALQAALDERAPSANLHERCATAALKLKLSVYKQAPSVMLHGAVRAARSARAAQRMPLAGARMRCRPC